jgi:N6-L-threonylcarbamoyladenine synthase
MLILGIETSCDETAASVVKNGTEVLSNVIHSQADMHAKTGGVVPEVAAREHVIKIIPVIQKALDDAKVTLKDIDRIAVTKEPGLLPALLIGLQTARTIGFATGISVDEVNHIEGHVFSNWLERDVAEIQFPVLVLTVSGGHNDLFLVKSFQEIERVGTTLDDAAGEAFDKVARLLDLGYPGGPKISKAAEQGSATAFDFPRAWISKKQGSAVWDGESYDFSFSGLKTAVRKAIEARNGSEGSVGSGNKDRVAGVHLASGNGSEESVTKDGKFVSDVAASFQESVCDVLSAKTVAAALKFGVKEVHLAGGVSANLRLREVVRERLSEGITFRHPVKFEYCTDNAAMIACAGYLNEL